MPRDPRATELAAAVLADPAAELDTLTSQVGGRTAERCFAAETGMSLGRWRRRARLLRALELLADGGSVTSTAAAVGYSTPSSFVASFRAELGHTPGESMRPREPVAERCRPARQQRLKVGGKGSAV